MTRPALLLTTAALLALAIQGTSAVAQPESPHPGGQPTLSPDAPRVGEPFTVRFPGTIPPGHRLLSVSGFDRRLVETLDATAHEDGTLVWTAVIDRPGTFRLDTLEARLIDDEGQGLRIDLPPLQVAITSILRDDEDLEPSLVAELRSLLRQLPPGPLAAGAGALLLLILLAAHRWRNRPEPPPPPPTPPDIEALDALDRLAAEPPETAEEFHDAHGELAHILRRFIGRTLDLSTLDKTTTEVVDLLRHELRANRVREPVAAILRACDRTRFAGQPATTADLIDLIDTTRRLVHTLTEECTPATDGEAAPKQRGDHPGRDA